MHLTLLARSPMEGSVSGLHKSPHRGSSVEFAEYRNYVPGDDIRRLDWRVFARTDRFFLKEYEAETNLRCYFVLDCSGSMKFGQAPGGKLDYAKRLIATLAYIAAHQGDAVGLVCAAGKTFVEIPPRRNPAHLKVLFETLEKAEARGETGLIAGLARFGGKSATPRAGHRRLGFFLRPGAAAELLPTSALPKARPGGFSIVGPRGVGFSIRPPGALRRFGKFLEHCDRTFEHPGRISAAVRPVPGTIARAAATNSAPITARW